MQSLAVPCASHAGGGTARRDQINMFYYVRPSSWVPGKVNQGWLPWLQQGEQGPRLSVQRRRPFENSEAIQVKTAIFVCPGD